MGAVPAHGITMGYVSGPFRTEDQNPTLKGSLSQPMVEPWGSRCESSRSDAIHHIGSTQGYDETSNPGLEDRTPLG